MKSASIKVASLKTSSACIKAIAGIREDWCNYSSDWWAGIETTLKASAQLKLDEINKKLDGYSNPG